MFTEYAVPEHEERDGRLLAYITSQLNMFDYFNLSTHCTGMASVMAFKDIGIRVWLRVQLSPCLSWQLAFFIISALTQVFLHAGLRSVNFHFCGWAKGTSTNASSLHLSPSLVARWGSHPKSHLVLSRNWTLRELHESNWPYVNCLWANCSAFQSSLCRMEETAVNYS